MNRLLTRRDVVAWTLYDWANSAFITSITVALLPLYLRGLFPNPSAATVNVVGFTWHTNYESLWSFANALAMAAAALLAPALGAMADSISGKRWFLGVCVVAGAAFTAGLAAVGPGQYLLCAGLYVFAWFFWGVSNIFYDGYLPDLTDKPADMDAISSAGYAIGYLGGGLMLAINALMVAKPSWFGLSGTTAAIRVSFVLVAAWWMLFALPLLLGVREKKRPSVRAAGVVREGVMRLKRTLRKVSRLPELARFLLAFMLYNTGIGTLIVVATAYGYTTLGLTETTLVGVMLMVQFVGVPAAFAYIWLSQRLGAKNSVLAGLVVYVATLAFAMAMHAAWQFWVLGVLVALVQGGTQAISRSLFGSMVPEGMSAEFFGFFSVFNKAGSFLGPLVFGLVCQFVPDRRLAILSLELFFVLGAVLLLTVRPQRAAQQAQAFAG